MTVGGNDVVGPVAAACATGVTPTCQATISTQLQQVATQLGATLVALREAAGPDTTIAVTTYYNGLADPRCGLAGLAPLGEVVLEGGAVGGVALPQGLNDVIAAAAARVGAIVVPLRGEVGVGELVGDCLHPNAEGHRVIAGEIADAVAGQRLTRPGRTI